MFDLLGLSSRSAQPSKDTSQDNVRKLLAGEMDARLQKLGEMAQQCEVKEKELRKMQEKITDDLHEARALYTQLHAVEESAISRPAEKDEREEDVEALHKEIDGLRRENARMAVTLAERERAGQNACRERDEMARLLSQRSAELEAAQAFLPRSESVTDSDVVELIDALNYEIMQAATTVAESLEGASRTALLPGAFDAEFKVQQKIYGPGVARLLLSPSDEEDPVLSLRVALQAQLARKAESYIVRWCHRDPASSAAMRRIMRYLRAHEPEHVAIRWSGLGHKYAKAAIDKGVTASVVAEDLSSYWADALSVAGYYHEADSTYRKSLVSLRAGPQLEEVSKLILELNEIIGQKVTRGWIRCMVVEDMTPFDAKTMEADIQSEGRGEQGVKPNFDVLCTTGLGLRREEDGTPPVLLVKPKVVAVPAART